MAEECRLTNSHRLSLSFSNREMHSVKLESGTSVRATFQRIFSPLLARLCANTKNNSGVLISYPEQHVQYNGIKRNRK